VIQAGQVVAFVFPPTDQAPGKLRPALLLRRLPGPHDDWRICMISSRIHQRVPEIDEVIRDSDPDFSCSGLKVTSLIRVTRLAVVSSTRLQGSIGRLSDDRLNRIRARLARWFTGVTADLQAR
jgi:mRNA interferase MazF